MTISRDYSRVPITEAIIDFHVELPEGVGLSDLERCQDVGHTNRKALNVIEDRVDFGREGSTVTTSRQVGFLFASADEKQLFEARCDGFTMHRLAPYQGWEPFRNEARRLWEIYRAVTRPAAITRVAVRYVNRLDIPLSRPDLTDYLTTLPDLPTGLLANVSDFFIQLRIPQEDLQAMLLLNEASMKPSPPGVASILLDIDLFRAAELPQDETSLWDLVERLRTRKNKVFEECITENTRRLIR